MGGRNKFKNNLLNAWQNKHTCAHTHVHYPLFVSLFVRQTIVNRVSWTLALYWVNLKVNKPSEWVSCWEMRVWFVFDQERSEGNKKKCKQVKEQNFSLTHSILHASVLMVMCRFSRYFINSAESLRTEIEKKNNCWWTSWTRGESVKLSLALIPFEREKKSFLLITKSNFYMLLTFHVWYVANKSLSKCMSENQSDFSSSQLL